MRQTRIAEGTQVLWKKARIVCEQQNYFAESFDESGGEGVFEMRQSCLYFFSLERTSEV